MREIIVRRQNNLLSVKSRSKRRQSGFTLVELAVATLIMMVGIVGVVQLVPASLQSNLNNRVDTTAMVFAQREMDQIINQPLTSATFTDSDGQVVNLGATYNMRWAVISTVSAGQVVSKRFIVGCRRVNGAGQILLNPAVVDTLVQK